MRGLLFLVSLCTVGGAHAQQSPPGLFAVGQTFSGYYTCTQGLTNIDLQILTTSSTAISAAFTFSYPYHPGGVSHPDGRTCVGSYYVYWVLDRATGIWSLQPIAPGHPTIGWIHNTCSYVTVGLRGTLSVSGNSLVYSGSIVSSHSACTTFSMTCVGCHTPTGAPTTAGPTPVPTTLQPTTFPTTLAPSSNAPTVTPTTAAPTVRPTTLQPSQFPTTAAPSSVAPTVTPTTAAPTVAPTTQQPSLFPTTAVPTSAAPTITPTSAAPSTLPPTPTPSTGAPTASAAPTTDVPTTTPTSPTPAPSSGPSFSPAPTAEPTTPVVVVVSGAATGGGSGSAAQTSIIIAVLFIVALAVVGIVSYRRGQRSQPQPALPTAHPELVLRNEAYEQPPPRYNGPGRESALNNPVYAVPGKAAAGALANPVYATV